MPQHFAGYRHCGPSHCPSALPVSPVQHRGGDGGKERDPRLKGEIICSLCPFLEKKSEKKKSFLSETSLSHPLCREELWQGLVEKSKMCFQKAA